MTTATLTHTEIRSRLEQELTPEVLAHAYETAALARRLARAHDIDVERAETAALVHDIADRYSDRELLDFAERYEIPVSLTEARIPKLLHGAVGAEILRREWGIEDEEILEAVRYHISGAPIMGPLAKLLFVADKLEPGRDRHYGGLESVRSLAVADLNAAILRLYAWRINQLVEQDRPIQEHLITARNMLFEEVRNAVR
jgi:predicted HD superfamily hydrolase involved in NAD metabolism